MTDNILSFVSLHKSIFSLPDTVLPKFVVLTGRNGSGKTHLLEAIKEGKIKSSLASNYKEEIQLFDWNNIIPKDTGRFDPSQEKTRKSNWFHQIETYKQQFLPSIQQFALQRGVPPENCSSIEKIKSLTCSKLKEIFNDENHAAQLHTELTNQLNNYKQNIFNRSLQIGDQGWQNIIPKVVERKPELFMLSSESDFFDDDYFRWGEVDVFQQAFGKVFATYRELVQENTLLKEYPPESDSKKHHLSDEKFYEEYGSPPWDFVNQILETCHLNFRIDNPPMHETGAYEPKLRKLINDVEMRFQDLSSGEKVLMSFALCLYNSQENKQEKNFPKLLLLDEVDAPLHPSMVLSLLNTIEDVLINDKGVSVILTTHSPSTVGLAPEETIYEMNPNGPSIQKISKSAAMSILTAGVPTLSISFDGRRQIFVESRTDARLYDKLYQQYKSNVDSERSLVFVEVGNTDKSGQEQNAGCDQVKRLVNTLTEGGNKSVLGLVDWDASNQPSDRIHVLSYGLRNGLESLLFDPVLLVALIVKVNPVFCQQKGILDKNEAYTNLGFWNNERWQLAVDGVQSLVLSSNGHDGQKVVISYLSGMSLNIEKNYIQMDDHDLEREIINSFGFLQPLNNRVGDLMNYIITNVIPDFPDIMPKDILETFDKLLKADI